MEYFVGFSEVDNEEKVIASLLKYANIKSIFIAPREPGRRLPEEFYLFYEEVVEKLREKLILEIQAINKEAQRQQFAQFLHDHIEETDKKYSLRYICFILFVMNITFLLQIQNTNILIVVL